MYKPGCGINLIRLFANASAKKLKSVSYPEENAGVEAFFILAFFSFSEFIFDDPVVLLKVGDLSHAQTLGGYAYHLAVTHTPNWAANLSHSSKTR